MVSEFTILGHRSRLANAPTAIERWLRTCWECGDRTSSNPRINLVFAATAPWSVLPIYEGAETTSLDGAALTWFRHGDRWWSTGQGAAGVELRLSEERVEIGVWPASDSNESVLLALHVAMCEALRACGLVPLHAAVAVRDGRATAFLGRSGVGKSTTLLSAIDSGWLPLAEDFAWLDPVTRQVHAWPGDRGVCLREEGLRRLSPRWQAAAWRPDRDDKLFLRYGDVAASRPTSAQLTRVVVLHRAPLRDGEIEPLDPRDATRALWEGAGVPLCRVSRAAFAARVPSLLAEMEWTRLVLGRGPMALE